MARKAKLQQVTFQCEDGSTIGMWTEDPTQAQHALVATKLAGTTVRYVVWYAATREELDAQLVKHAKVVAKHHEAHQIEATSYAVAVAA